MSVFWIIFSYILGSIPFGFLISKLSGKNILEIGWKKSSGSNVFKNVGKWQGLLTAILDISKGYLTVFIAQKLGFSLEIQILSGFSAVIGHNWSVFLRFAGGRGIGTFFGAFLALSPMIFSLSLIVFIVLSLIWNAAIGTLLFLFCAIILSFYFKQLETAGFFTFLILLPVFIKRLSPISEIGKSENKLTLVRNRIIFDNDEFLKEFRIKRILGKRNSNILLKMAKILIYPLILPPKVGWKVAKFGAKAVKKPIEMLFKPPEKVVTEITAEDFKKIMIAASKKIVLNQEEINRINVFPVADKDTGYNMAATLLGIEGVVSLKNYSSFRELTKDIKDAAMINARGNAGMILTGYFIEVLDRIKHLDSVSAFHLAFAMQKGIKAARESIAVPVEGTILDIIKSAGEKAYEEATKKKNDGKPEKNIIKILEEAYKSAEISLKETTEKLEVLKQNNVVDAGGLGFVKIIEAWVENLKGVAIVSKTEVLSSINIPEVKKQFGFRYELIIMFRKSSGIKTEDLKKELSFMGDSLDIIELEGKIKIHIHTNQPEDIARNFKGFSEFEYRIENLFKEEGGKKRKPLGLIVDQVADLPKEFLEKYDITEIPFGVRFPGGEIISSKEEFYKKMKETIEKGGELPTTSAPSFQAFLSAYQEAFKKFEKIFVITVSSRLSGTYSSARIARSVFKKPEKINIYVFDCFTAEAGEGLVVLRAQELVSQGKNMEEIIEDLKILCPKIVLIGCSDNAEYIIHGGRMRLPKILGKIISLIQKTGIKALVGLQEGKIKIFGIKLGKDRVRIIVQEIEKIRRNRKIKVAITHSDDEKTAEKIKIELEKKQGIEVLFISSASPVVMTHVGPKALMVAFYPIDND